MDTEVIRVGPDEDSAGAVRRATEVLTGGGLVAFPTETVYGVAARVDKTNAIDRLRRVKSRGSDQAFTVHIGSARDAKRYAPGLAGLAGRFARKGWPGPLTLIVRVDDPSAASATENLDGQAIAAMYYGGTVGLRCPDAPIATALLNSVASPLVAASANPTGRQPPLTGDGVLAGLNGQVDLLIDGGRTRYDKPSTIVRITDASYEVVREGVHDAATVARLSTLRLLLVCTGNTCRSPMGAAITKEILARRLGCGIDELDNRGIEVRSAGTAGGFGGASDHAETVMGRRGLDLSDHMSAVLTAEKAQQADYVFAMTRSHRDNIVRLAPAVADRVMLVLEDQDVHDPIGGSEDDYERCARAVEQGLRERLREVDI